MPPDLANQFNPLACQADFTYAITPKTVEIQATGKGKKSVADDLEAVLLKIEYWHQGSIAAFKIMYDEHGVWDGVRWDGRIASFFAIRETDETRAMEQMLSTQSRR